MPKKTILIIVAVAVMLVGASSAYAYKETWDGKFRTGTLYYDGKTYTHAGGSGEFSDSTISTRDTFYYSGNPFSIPFVNSVDEDTIILSITSITGGKPTGRSGTKNGSGSWSGSAIRRKNTVLTTFTSVSGTWSATFSYVDCPPNKPTYTGIWLVTASTPSGLTGGGTSYGNNTSYTP